MRLITFTLFITCCESLSYLYNTSNRQKVLYAGDPDLPQHMRGYFVSELGPNFVTIRLTIMMIIVSLICVLGFMVVYGVNKFMSTPRRNREKFSVFIGRSYGWDRRGRSRVCIEENGCSGGTIDSSQPVFPRDK
jgi:hypothetical protein